MKKFIPIFVAVIFGLVASTSGFKCYECDSISDPDCENSVGQKFEVTCPEFIGSQNTGSKKLADFIVSFLPPRNDRPLTKAISPKVFSHHCVRFVGTQGANDVVMRMCLSNPIPIETRCEEGESGGVKGEVCVCNTELCNGGSKDQPNGAMALKSFLILPILGILAYSLF